MIRYTTPTLKFKLPFEANYLTVAFITLSQRNSCIEKSIDATDVNSDSQIVYFEHITL